MTELCPRAVPGCRCEGRAHPAPALSDPTLAVFLLARIAEDEAREAHGYWCSWAQVPGAACDCPRRRVVSECEAKRLIVAAYERAGAGGSYRVTRYGLVIALRYLAAAYANHPDYRDEWRPA